MRAALADLSAALASGDVTAVLTAERPLADAVRQLTLVARTEFRSEVAPRPEVVRTELRSELRVVLDDTVRMLRRCQLLGESAREIAAAGLAAHQGYGRRGALVAVSPRATIDSRS